MAGALEAVLDQPLAAALGDAPRVPGALPSHYAPQNAAMEYLHQFQEESLRDRWPFVLHGTEGFYPFTSHPLAARMQDTKLVKEKDERTTRAQAMAEVAAHLRLDFTPDPVAVLNHHNFIYPRRGENRMKSNLMTGTRHGYHVTLFDYSHTAARDHYVEHRHTLVILHRTGNGVPQLLNLAVTPGQYLERYLVEYQELGLEGLDTLAQHSRVYAHANDQVSIRVLLDARLARALLKRPGFYVEIRDGVLLMFCPGHELEQVEEMPRLLAFAMLLARAVVEAA